MAPSKIISEHQNQNKNPQLQQKTVAAMMSKITGRVSTRSQSNAKALAAVFERKVTVKEPKDLTKRKADQLSPPKGKTTKRTALCDISVNAANKNVMNEKNKTAAAKKGQTTASNLKQKEIVKISTTAQCKAPVLVNVKALAVNKANVINIENIDPNAKPKAAKQCQLPVHKENHEPREADAKFDTIHKVTSSGRISTRFRRSLDACQDKSDESSLYTSALEDMPQACDDSMKILSPVKKEAKHLKEDKAATGASSPQVPEGVEDFDKENIMDPIQVSNYAMEIFQYMKNRERSFQVQDYMSRQVLINKWMRSLLVDWMVEVQESFELNHETLYLGVKITDVYLNKVVVGKEVLQLVGTAALFIASKYDERMPPLIDDFLYICEKAFTREDIIRMEMDVFRVIGYNLGIPLSYRFLRRFARCCKASMPTLTLARYILELSLMEYHLIFVSESKLACASLYLALRMKNISHWTPTLEYYSGYKLEEFASIVHDLNSMLHRKPIEQLKTVRNKYSHKIFFEVAKTPLIEDSELC